jgi:hypothetical protein
MIYIQFTKLTFRPNDRPPKTFVISAAIRIIPTTHELRRFLTHMHFLYLVVYSLFNEVIFVNKSIMSTYSDHSQNARCSTWSSLE